MWDIAAEQFQGTVTLCLATPPLPRLEKPGVPRKALGFFVCLQLLSLQQLSSPLMIVVLTKGMGRVTKELPVPEMGEKGKGRGGRREF